MIPALRSSASLLRSIPKLSPLDETEVGPGYLYLAWMILFTFAENRICYCRMIEENGIPSK
jgi:hypothetical protein